MIHPSSLPMRFPEMGRIRLGEKGPKGQPVKGRFLRFSSNDEGVLSVLADRLGGTVVPWPKGEQTHHLLTESESVDVFLPPDPVDTAYERWGSGGCQRRCDGRSCSFLAEGPDGMFLDHGPCRCLLENMTPGDRDDVKDRGACAITVRLRVLIPDVPGIGVWVCTSHSIYAAMELPAQAAVIAASSPLREDGSPPPLVPAEFAIDPRTEKKPWEKYERKYIVPVLRVRKSLAQLMGTTPASITNGHRPALVEDTELEADRSDIRSAINSLSPEARRSLKSEWEAQGLPQVASLPRDSVAAAWDAIDKAKAAS